jgi:hypothetical protein
MNFMPVEVDPNSLRQVAQQLTGITQDTDGTLRMFENLIDSIGDCWGDDDLGSMIGMIYQGAMALVINCFMSNLDTLDQYVERLGIAANIYEEADAWASEMLKLVEQSGPNVAM